MSLFRTLWFRANATGSVVYERYGTLAQGAPHRHVPSQAAGGPRPVSAFRGTAYSDGFGSFCEAMTSAV